MPTARCRGGWSERPGVSREKRDDQGRRQGLLAGADLQDHDAVLRDVSKRDRSENAILAPFLYKNDDFAKTGSGQT